MGRPGDGPPLIASDQHMISAQVVGNPLPSPSPGSNKPPMDEGMTPKKFLAFAAIAIGAQILGTAVAAMIARSENERSVENGNRASRSYIRREARREAARILARRDIKHHTALVAVRKQMVKAEELTHRRLTVLEARERANEKHRRHTMAALLSKYPELQDHLDSLTAEVENEFRQEITPKKTKKTKRRGKRLHTAGPDPS